MNKNAIVQLLVVVVIIGAYFLIDFNKLYNSIIGEGEFVTQDTTCELKKGPCSITIADGTKFTMDIYPREIPLMKPLTFKVKSSNKELKNLTLTIYATNMMMGNYEIDLKPKGNGIYEAIGTLPTCPVGFMNWNADIKINKISKIIGARFQFKTDI